MEQAADLVREGELLWRPSSEQVAAANLTAFTGWLARERGLRFAGYDQLWRRSVEDLEGFWQAIWNYFEVEASAPATTVLGDRRMPGAAVVPGRPALPPAACRSVISEFRSMWSSTRLSATGATP